MTVLCSANLNDKQFTTMANLSLKEVKRLASSANSCIVKKEEKIQLLIQPCYANSLKKGIRVAMDNLSIGFCQHLGGLVLGYEDVKVLPWSGSVHSTNPLVHLHVYATFYVFAPTKGLLIEGIVNKVTPHMVSFLAYNKYNIIYRVHQVRQELRERSLRSGNPKAKETAKLVLAHLQELNLTEGMSSTLLLQEVALRDFLPSLLGYPVPEWLDVTSLNDASMDAPLPLADSSKKRVRFSDEESVDSGCDRVASEQPSSRSPSDAHLNGGVEDSSDSDPDSEPTHSKNKTLTNQNKLKDVSSSQEEISVASAVDDENEKEVFSPAHPHSKSSSVPSTPNDLKSPKTKSRKSKRKSTDVGDGTEMATLAAVIEDSKLCNAQLAGRQSELDFLCNTLGLTNGTPVVPSSPKKSTKRKRDESGETEGPQKTSKKSRKK